MPYIKIQSVYGITSKYENYIRNVLGKRQMRFIDTLEWQKLFNKIEYPTSAKKLLSYMKSCYKKAVLNNIVIDNPMLGVEIHNNHRKKKKYVPTRKELSDFLDYLEDKRKDLKLVCEFISLTGLRIGEACALTINDIDFKNKNITINKSYNRFSKKISSTKTSNSDRIIPLLDKTKNIINEYINLYGNKKIIFHKMKSQNITNTLKYHANQFGLCGLTPHILRHFYSTVCIEAGIHQKVVQKWLGHSSVLMTLDLYTDVKEEFKATETQKLASFINA